MGEINPTAIEAYTEMKKRYEFILEQKNDLVNAKESLLATIQEVESTANQKFLDTFNQVKDNFIRVFKALFTEEDQCDMVLSDPSNLADTGIEIIAKPKGKTSRCYHTAFRWGKNAHRHGAAVRHLSYQACAFLYPR